jgi:hypothetical protein
MSQSGRILTNCVGCSRRRQTVCPRHGAPEAPFLCGFCVRVQLIEQEEERQAGQLHSLQNHVLVIESQLMEVKSLMEDLKHCFGNYL